MRLHHPPHAFIKSTKSPLILYYYSQFNYNSKRQRNDGVDRPVGCNVLRRRLCESKLCSSKRIIPKFQLVRPYVRWFFKRKYGTKPKPKEEHAESHGTGHGHGHKPKSSKGGSRRSHRRKHSSGSGGGNTRPAADTAKGPRTPHSSHSSNKDRKKA